MSHFEWWVPRWTVAINSMVSVFSCKSIKRAYFCHLTGFLTKQANEIVFFDIWMMWVGIDWLLYVLCLHYNARNMHGNAWEEVASLLAHYWLVSWSMRWKVNWKLRMWQDFNHESFQCSHTGTKTRVQLNTSMSMKQTWGCGISTCVQTFCWSDDKLFAPVKAGERLVEAVQPQHQYCRQSRSSCSEPSENPPTPPFTGLGKGAEMQTPTWLSNIILQFLHLPNWRMRSKDRSRCCKSQHFGISPDILSTI